MTIKVHSEEKAEDDTPRLELECFGHSSRGSMRPRALACREGLTQESGVGETTLSFCRKSCRVGEVWV